GRGDIALDQRDVLGMGHAVDVDVHAELAAPAALEIALKRALDDAVVTAAIGNQVGDRADLQAVTLGKGNQIVTPRHRAVIVHYFADHARRIEAGEARDVDGRLGMTGAYEHAAATRYQREDMSGRNDVAPVLGRIDGGGDRASAIGRGDACRDA